MYSAICLAENSIILSNSLCSKCFSFVTCVLHVSVNTSLIMQIYAFFFYISVQFANYLMSVVFGTQVTYIIFLDFSGEERDVEHI